MLAKASFPHSRLVNIVSPRISDCRSSSPAVTDGREYDDKPHWAPDGRTLYFVSHRDGALNVWGRRFDPIQGTPIGAPFQVTRFSGRRQMISASLQQMQIALTADRLFLPITETQSELWILDNVDR